MVFDLLRAYDRDCRENLRVSDPAYRVEKEADVTRLIGPSELAFENCVVWSTSASDALIQAQIRRFQGRDFEWKHYSHDAPGDLDVRLSRAGFQRGDTETLMALDVERFQGKPTRFDIRKIGAERLKDVMSFQPAGFEWLEAGLRRELAVDPASLSIYVAYRGDLPISTGWIRFGPRFATIHGGATLPEWRGQGAYAAILARRVGEARARGVSWIVSDCTEMSRPRLEGKGFIALSKTTPFTWRRTP